jgi:hypothetical protein
MAPMETTNQNGKEQAEEPSEASLFLEVWIHINTSKCIRSVNSYQFINANAYQLISIHKL